MAWPMRRVFKVVRPVDSEKARAGGDVTPCVVALSRTLRAPPILERDGDALLPIPACAKSPAE
jgi:hypothetical protein